MYSLLSLATFVRQLVLAIFVGAAEGIKGVLRPEQSAADSAITDVLESGKTIFDEQWRRASSWCSSVKVWADGPGSFWKPLSLFKPSTVNFQITPADRVDVLDLYERYLLEADVPASGLETFWVLTSDAFRFEPVKGDVTVRCDRRSTSPKFSAMFPMGMRRGEPGAVQQLQMTPLRQTDLTVEMALYVNGALYRRLVVEGNVGSLSESLKRFVSDIGSLGKSKVPNVGTLEYYLPGESLKSKPSRSGEPAVRIKSETVLGPGSQLAPIGDREWQSPTGRLSFDVKASGTATVISPQIDFVPWTEVSSALNPYLKSLYDVADVFREIHSDYLDNIDINDLQDRLNTFPRRVEPAHTSEGSWSEVVSSKELEDLASYGAALYLKILSKEAREYIEKLAVGGLLQIIWPNGVHVPWTLLYMGRPDGKVDPLRFLGLRFRLQYHSRADSPPGPRLGSLREFRTAYCLNWGKELTGESELQKRAFESGNALFVPQPGQTQTRIEQLREFLRSPAPGPVRVLYFYCECDMNVPAQPRLFFGDDLSGEILSHRDMLLLTFEDRPVVFMNACNSSVASSDMTNQLEDTFFQARCRAYIGSEANLPVAFAGRFGVVFQRFFLGNIDGSRVSLGEAMYQARSFLWNNYRNLGGILYSHSQDYLAYVDQDDLGEAV